MSHEGPAPLDWGDRTGCAGLPDVLLAAVTVEDVRLLLLSVPRPFAREMLRQVGLRDSRRISERVAEAVLRLLRTGEPRRRRVLREILGSGYERDFGNPDGLTAEDCHALLDPDRAATVLARAPFLAGALTCDWPVPILRWGLARVIELDRPLAPVALGLLAGEPDVLGDTAEAVATAWTALRERHPTLPEHPLGFTALRDLARRRSAAPPATDEENDVTDQAEAVAEPPAPVVAAALEELRDRLPAVMNAAERTVAGLRTGRRPDDDDLKSVGDFATDFDRVRGQIGMLAAEAVTAADLDSLSAVLDTARQADARAAWIRALVGIRGPDVVAAELDEVRRMAHEGAGDGLDVLAELIEVTCGPDDDLRAPALADKAREQLPERCRRLVDIALMGKLTIVPPPEDPPSAEREGDDDGGQGPGDEPDPFRPDDDLAVESRAEAADEIDDDLADLDALISETASAPRQEVPAPRAEVPSAPEPVSVTTAEDAPPPAAVTASVPAEPHLGQDPGLAPQVAEAEVAALRAGRFGLAGRLRTGAGRPAAEEAARRCAAIAAEMATFAGPLSAEFAAAARDVTARSLAGDPAGRVLAWAAGIRAGLVHPTHESTRLVEELTANLVPDLADCGNAFVQAARGGAYLGSDVAGRVRGAAESGLARRHAVREAARVLAEEPHRKILYAFATDVWKALLQPDAKVGRLLDIAAQDDPTRADEAAAEITRLRAGGEIDRLIDETTRALTGGRRRTKKIIARARLQLVAKIENALDTVGEWVRAVKEARDRQAADAQGWQSGPLGQLHEAVGERRTQILAALGELAACSDGVTSAAAEAARDLIAQTLDLLDGAALPESEPPVAQVVNRDLLLASSVPLHPTTLEPLEPPTDEQLVAVASADEETWRRAFWERAERGDHEGTHGIITVLERRDPQTAAELRERREKLIPAAREARDARVEEIRDLLARWVRDGALTEKEVRRAEERLTPLTEERRDFDRIGRDLDGLREQLEDQRREGIAAERARLEQRAAEDPRVAAVQDRIAERIEQGDLTTAREFLAQIEAGRQLHEPSEGIDHLRRFHPAFPRAFADSAVRAGARARKQETIEFLTELIDALKAGRDVDDPDLAALLRGADIHIPSLRNARREESKEGLRLWRACGLKSQTSANLRSAVAAVLRMIGLEGAQRTIPGAPGGGHRIWIDLERIQAVGDALLPAFGSRMSPSVDRLRLLLVWRRPGPQQLIEMLKGQPEDQTVLIWYFGVLSPEDRQQLAAAARKRPAPVAGVLDDAAISYLACMPEADWAAAVALMAPFTATNPYAPVGDVPDEMFYGRADQLREVTDRTGSSFVYGGRQLGKSALLRKAERQVRATDPDRTVILENIQNIGKVVPLESLWSKLADKLVQAGVLRAGLVNRRQVCDGIRAWVDRNSRRQVLILLDEADHFLNEDAKGARFENVIALRDLMQETNNRVKVVFAGLHQTARFQSLTNQPLAHLGTPIAVGPLEPQNAYDLLVRPLATLGFRFPEMLAARVIAEANNAPALVQLFAEELLKRLRRGSRAVRQIPYEITSEDVSEVWRDKALARGFRDRFEWTLNLDKRYKVIAYTVALHALTDGPAATLGVGDLWEECRYWWEAGFEDCTSDDFRSLLDECVNLGVLGLDSDGYRLRTPHILNLLGGTAEVEEVLENADEFDKPDSFDAHSYHGVYKDGPERSPLSSRQLTTLFHAHDLVHVVTGSKALHVERVAHALEAEESGHPGVKVHLVCQGRLTFDGAIARAEGHDGHTVIVVKLPEGKTRQRLEPLLRRALEAVAAPHRGTLAVVLVTGPGLACAWRDLLTRDGIDVVQLRRFDRLAIRQWMWEEAYGFTDETGQDALLATTGGWPTLIGQILNRLTEHGGDRDDALARCREHLESSPEQFVTETGMLADPPLAAAWRTLVAHDAPETSRDLATLLDMHSEEVPALNASALAAHDYDGTADLVEALRLLGALEPKDGRLACEPVLAKATRSMGEAR